MGNRVIDQKKEKEHSARRQCRYLHSCWKIGLHENQRDQNRGIENTKGWAEPGERDVFGIGGNIPREPSFLRSLPVRDRGRPEVKQSRKKKKGRGGEEGLRILDRGLGSHARGDAGQGPWFSRVSGTNS